MHFQMLNYGEITNVHKTEATNNQMIISRFSVLPLGQTTDDAQIFTYQCVNGYFKLFLYGTGHTVLTGICRNMPFLVA